MAEKIGGLIGGDGTGNSRSKDQAGIVPVATPSPIVVAKARERRALPRVGTATPPKFAIALDATGSMSPSIDDARRHIAEILKRVRAQLGDAIKVQFLCYRDYVGKTGVNQLQAGLIEESPVTEDPKALAEWLAKIEAKGGGSNGGEAVEVALKSIHESMTKSGVNITAVLLVGDEPSNPLHELRDSQTATAHDWARQLGECKVPIHAFVVKHVVSDVYTKTIADFEEIARLSGGKSGRLDGTDSMLNMAALAMVSAAGGADAVTRYSKQYQLSGPEKAFATLLLAGPTR